MEIKKLQQNMVDRDIIQGWFKELQSAIAGQLEEADGKGKFILDPWERPGGGGGVSAVLTNGDIIEKGGVNFSAVWGQAPAAVLQSMNMEPAPDIEFFATGVSIVIHPVNPMVPIIHMNVRYFEINEGSWWFGGGIDLTPHYVDREDAAYFHQTLRSVCDKHHNTYYAEFKRWADDYFYLKHRKETRGIGGIFFDYLKGNNNFTRESRFSFVQDVGLTFAPLYIHFMKKNHLLPFGEKEKAWQALRRGRYVEFNLVWDRGTRFGLDTDGRTESILMSLPPEARWAYNHQPQEGTREAETLSLLRKNINWSS